MSYPPPLLGNGPCGDCKYWQRDRAQGGTPNPTFGTCRRLPPQFGGIVQQANPLMPSQVMMGTRWFQPALPEDYPGCGEFELPIRLV
jgi:hypothetical protein